MTDVPSSHQYFNFDDLCINLIPQKSSFFQSFNTSCFKSLFYFSLFSILFDSVFRLFQVLNTLL